MIRSTCRSKTFIYLHPNPVNMTPDPLIPRRPGTDSNLICRPLHRGASDTPSYTTPPFVTPLPTPLPLTASHMAFCRPFSEPGSMPMMLARDKYISFGLSRRVLLNQCPGSETFPTAAHRSLVRVLCCPHPPIV